MYRSPFKRRHGGSVTTSNDMKCNQNSDCIHGINGLCDSGECFYDVDNHEDLINGGSCVYRMG